MKAKWTIPSMIIIAVIFSGTWIYHSWAGDLNPTLPPGPTMHTLNEIYANTSKVVIEPQALARPRGRAFLWVDTIPGESQDPRHVGWIDIFGFTDGHSQSGSFHVGGGGGGGKASFQDITVIREVDKASVLLTKMVAKGSIVPQVKIEIVALPPAKPVGVFQVILTKVMCTSVSRKMEYRGSDFVLMEYVTFNTEKEKWIYREQLEEGSLGPEIQFEWDIAANAEVP